jgi:hypothetical protein
MSNQLHQRRSQILHKYNIPPNGYTIKDMTKTEFQALNNHKHKKFDTNKTASDDEWESDDDTPTKSVDTGSIFDGNDWFRVYSMLVVVLTLVVLLLFLKDAVSKQLTTHIHSLPGGYRSVEEMVSRPLRFPSVEDRIKLYMSSWYSPPCPYSCIDGKSSTSDNSTFPTNCTLPQFNFLHGSPDELPVLLLQELKLQTSEHELFGRLFVVDIGAEPKGSVIFYMDPLQIQQCNNSFCLDTKAYLLPALKRIQEATGKYWEVPVLLEFGDAEVSRAYRPATNKNESYPTVPLIKKFRYSMNRDEVRRITSRTCYDVGGTVDHDIPMTRKGERRIQPSK